MRYLTDNQNQKTHKGEKRSISMKIFPVKYLLIQKKVSTFASAIEKQTLEKRKRNGNVSPNDGPFVYRLGRKIFILERGVRFPHGLQLKK